VKKKKEVTFRENGNSLSFTPSPAKQQGGTSSCMFKYISYLSLGVLTQQQLLESVSRLLDTTLTLPLKSELCDSVLPQEKATLILSVC
jgi:hypothetical protein